MAQLGNLYLIESNPVTQFILATAQNASDGQNIALPGALKPHGRSRIKSIVIVSKDNLAWELDFFGSGQFDNVGGAGAAELVNGGDPAGSAYSPVLGQPVGGQPTLVYESFRGKKAFATTDAIQFGATGLWYYYIDGIDIPYQDSDYQVFGGAPVQQFPSSQPGGLPNPAYVPSLHVKLTNRSAGGKTAGANTFLLRVFAELTAGS